MKSLLESFAESQLVSGPRCLCNDQLYEKLLAELCRLEDTLRTTLNEEQQLKLEHLQTTQDDLSELAQIDRFIYGYRLGVLMTMEVVQNAEKLACPLLA